MNENLVTFLRERGAGLTEKVLAEMYLHPFWDERYGDRGRHHTRQDGGFHITYLATTLETGDPGVMTRYSRWLQGLLTSRGMCTRHIDENFVLLGRAIAREVDAPDPALEVLAEARRSLRYESGIAGWLQDRAEGLARAVVASLRADSGLDPDARIPLGPEVLDHVAYLADALHLGRPELFLEHQAWMGRFLARHGLPAARLSGALIGIRDRIREETTLGSEDRDRACSTLDAAVGALEAGVMPP